MNEAEFKARTKQLGIDYVRLCQRLPKDAASGPLVNQLVRSSTSVGSNYRASCRARSINEILAKLAIVEEEADETAYWLEVLAETQIATRSSVEPLHREANQIVAMIVASKRTLKSRAGTKGFASVPNQIVNRES